MVFQVHGADAAGGVVLHKKLPRARLLACFGGAAVVAMGLEAAFVLFAFSVVERLRAWTRVVSAADRTPVFTTGAAAI